MFFEIFQSHIKLYVANFEQDFQVCSLKIKDFIEFY